MVRVAQVSPWIERDIEKARRCNADRILEELLWQCQSEGSQSIDDRHQLLKQCMIAVLPTCNGQQVGNQGVDAGGIRNKLEA